MNESGRRVDRPGARATEYHLVDIGLKVQICERVTIELLHARESGL